MKKAHLAHAMLLFVTLIWGSSFFITKKILDDNTPPFTLMMYRALIAFVLITPIYIKVVMKEKIRWKDTKYGFILGVYIFLGFALQTVGQYYTTPSKNAFLSTLNVVFVPMILFIVYKRKFNRIHILAVSIALVGAFVMSGLSVTLGIGNPKESLGDFLTVLSAIFWAMQIIKTGEYAKKVNIWILMYYQFMVMFILSGISILIFNQTPKVSIQSLLGISYLAVFCTVITFSIMAYALKYALPEKAALIFTFEGVFGTLFSILFKVEELTIAIIIGGSIIFLGVIISELNFNSLNNYLKEKKNTSEERLI